jgi:hypothetical protein
MTDDDLPDGYRLAAGQWEVECGTGPCVACHAGTLGVWGAGETTNGRLRVGAKIT